jgi:hypothetical protein
MERYMVYTSGIGDSNKRETKRGRLREETKSRREKTGIVPDQPIATGATQNKEIK